MWYEIDRLKEGRTLRTERAKQKYMVDHHTTSVLVFADIFHLGEDSGAHYIQELAAKDKQPLDWFTVEELTGELKKRFPGAGMVCCEELSKTNEEAHIFEIAWGPLHRVAGLAFGLRTMVEHQYYTVRAIGDLRADITDKEDTEDE